LDFSVFVAKIGDECILGVDFLEQIGLGKIFTSVFGQEESEKQKSFLCSRIFGVCEKISQNFLEIYEKNSATLDVTQKEEFAKVNRILRYFHRVVAENCSVIEHAI